MRICLGFVGIVAALCLAGESLAHEVRPAFLSITESDSGTFDVLWKQPTSGDYSVRIIPHLSDGSLERAPDVFDHAPGFRIVQWSALEGSPAGLELWVEGLDRTITQAFLSVRWADGRSQSVVLTPSEPAVTLRRQAGGTSTYFALGIEHILTGLDHLMFVFGLVLLISDRKKLLIAISAFTVAHSITLALAVFGFVAVPVATVECLVALSVACLAAEIVRAGKAPGGLGQTHSWAMAFAFGLLHGLAFAGGLSEIGMPADRIPRTLLAFNVGVEVGQLLFVAVLLALAPLAVRLPRGGRRRVRWGMGYAMGIAAGYWCLERFGLESLTGLH